MKLTNFLFKELEGGTSGKLVGRTRKKWGLVFTGEGGEKGKLEFHLDFGGGTELWSTQLEHLKKESNWSRLGKYVWYRVRIND